MSQLLNSFDTNALSIQYTIFVQYNR